MVRKVVLSSISILFLFNLLIVNVQGSTNIELFDIEENKVIKTMPTNLEIQLEVENVIKEIDNVVKRLNPFPDKGYMVKIPLKPSILLENQWLYAQIDEVIIIVREDEKPYLLVFDDENTPHFFTFKSRIDALLNPLDYPL